MHSQRWHGHRGSRVLVVAAASLSAVTLAAGCSSSSSKGADSPAVATTSAGPDVTASPVPSATPTPSPTPTLKPLTVLVTNDDGVHAEGIDAVVQALRAEPGLTIKVVGPATNQSGKGGTTTPGGNVTYTNTKTISGYAAVAVNGTPADSANVAFDKLGIKPDVTISGTNAGQNLGPVVDLSGTVGAARVAARHGVPALAVSSGFADKIDYASGAKYAIMWLRELRPTLPLASSGSSGTVTGLNVPTCTTGTIRGELKVTLQKTLLPGESPLAKQDCTSTAKPTTEIAAFTDGFATIMSVPGGALQLSRYWALITRLKV